MGRNEPWSKADDATLRELYPVHGPSWDGWADVLEVPRSPRAISTHAYGLSLHVTNGNAGGHWATCPQDAVIMDDAARGRLRRAYMAGVPLELLSERFGRTPDALRAILRRGGVRC